MTTRNLRRNANEYLRSAISCSRPPDSGHASHGRGVTNVVTVSVSSHHHEPEDVPGPGSLDSEPRTFIVSAGPDTRDDPQPAVTTETETDPQPWDNNALTPEQEPDHQQPEINSPTIYQSTVRQILTPYKNIFPQPSPNNAISPTQNSDGKCYEEGDSESRTSDPRLSDQLIRRSSGPGHDEYITLNISDSTHAEPTDTETVGIYLEKNKQQKNVEKCSHLEPIYESFSSGNA